MFMRRHMPEQTITSSTKQKKLQEDFANNVKNWLKKETDADW